jgi:hypothetical protein
MYGRYIGKREGGERDYWGIGAVLRTVREDNGFIGWRWGLCRLDFNGSLT